MDIINLVTSVKEGLFLHNAILPYDAIVWENVPQELDKRFEHISLTHLSYDFGIGGQLAQLSNKYNRLLVVVETISSLYLLPWLQSLADDKSVTILAVNAGISGYMNKSEGDMTDIATLMSRVRVQEAYDQDTLFALLDQKGKNYIRLSYADTHTSLFPKTPAVEGGISDLRELGFEGVAGTIVAPGGVLVNTIHAVQHLQQEGKFFDLFALLDYDFTISGGLKESIIKTENVIVLLDQKRRTHYEAVVKAKLWDAGLVDTQIHFVYPNVDKINTILPEYLWEQANWDGLGIAEKINSIH